MKISIIIPALNEEGTIGIVASKAKSSLTKLHLTGEVIVVDNQSTDNTAAKALSLGCTVITSKTKGYGAGLQTGFAMAQGEYLLMADADDSYNLEEIAPFITKLDEGYDLVMGNRFKGTIMPNAMPWLHHYVGTPVLTFILNLFFKAGIGDINCGMRALRKSAYVQLDCHCPGMEFASEMLIEASLKKLKIAEIPCNLYRDKRNRKPHLNTWKDGWRHLNTICKLKLRSWR